MRLLKDLKSLNKFEIILLVFSNIVIFSTHFFLPNANVVSTFASMIGVTSLVFIAKGVVLGQILCIIFSIFYGLISLANGYYGEMLTYVCMTLPMNVFSLISWIRHPFKDTNEVEVSSLSIKKILLIFILSLGVTIIFYFVLKALNTASLIVSTISITTSFIAVSLTFFRSPYYALAYATNDLVLIVLWIIATFKDSSNFTMILCFIIFLVNDIYGFINWKKMQKNQQ